MAAPVDQTRILSSERENGGKSAAGLICQLCLKARAPYTCPRCNVSYCSLACYRSEKHGDCSESFYKNNFMQALKQTKGSSEDKKKIFEMLTRLDAEEPGSGSDDDEDDNDADSLEKRLAGLDLDKDADKVWERLNPQERQEFDDVLRAGALGSILEEWHPWWTRHDRELISELSDDNKPLQSSKVSSEDPPKVLDSIPRLSELLKTSPSPVIVYNLINVLYCYAFVTKLYNGSHMDMPLHAAQSFQEVCSVVSAKVSFTCVQDAIQSATHTISQLKSLPGERSHLVSVVLDVVHILLGRSQSSPAIYVEAALSDLHEVLRRARAIYKKVPAVNKSKVEKAKSAMFQAKKKVTFYLAWARENQSSLKEKAVELKLLHGSMEADLKKHKQVKVGVEKSLEAIRPKSKPMIQEID